MLMIDSIQYEHHYLESENPVTIETGKELGKVTYTMADKACSNHRLRNGDAAYLEEGTIIYEIKGYPTSLVVAADNLAYVVDTNWKAETAGELYPLDKLVKNIYMNSLEDGKRIHTFSQAAKDEFLSAFYNLELEHVQSLVNKGKLEGNRVFLEIELNNRISFRELYWRDSNTFHFGAIGNNEIKEIINEELLKIKK